MGGGHSARAAEAPVAVVPFTGLHAGEAQKVVERALKPRVVVVKREGVERSGAAVAITGNVELRGTKQLTVTVLSPSGEVLTQLTYPILRGRHLAPEQLTQLEADVRQAVAGVAPSAAAAAQDGQEAQEPPAEVPAGPVEQAGDSEKVRFSEPAPAMRRSRTLLPPRPVWAPLIELSVGPMVSSRAVEFDQPLPRGYRPGVAGGLLVDATVYPLAALHHKARGAFAGLGLGGTVVAPFWLTTKVDGTSEEHATSELAVEGAVRWRFTLRRLQPRVDLTVIGGGGFHSFTIDKGTTPTGAPVDVGPPDVRYLYATFGLQGRVHPTSWSTVHLAFNYHYVPDAGPVEDWVRYGLADTFGLRLRAGLEIAPLFRKAGPAAGLRVGASAYWERFGMSFVGTPGRGRLASNAVDQFYGGVLTVGYVL